LFGGLARCNKVNSDVQLDVVRHACGGRGFRTRLDWAGWVKILSKTEAFDEYSTPVCGRDAGTQKVQVAPRDSPCRVLIPDANIRSLQRNPFTRIWGDDFRSHPERKSCRSRLLSKSRRSTGHRFTQVKWRFIAAPRIVLERQVFLNRPPSITLNFRKVKHNDSRAFERRHCPRVNASLRTILPLHSTMPSSYLFSR